MFVALEAPDLQSFIPAVQLFQPSLYSWETTKVTGLQGYVEWRARSALLNLNKLICVQSLLTVYFHYLTIKLTPNGFHSLGVNLITIALLVS